MGNFMAADATASVEAVFIFALFTFVPGYFFSWLLNIFGFRQRALAARITISVPVSIAIFPILLDLVWRLLPGGVWILYGCCWIGFLGVVAYDRRVWSFKPPLSR